LKTTGEEDVLYLGREENKTKKNHTFRLPHSLQFHFAAHTEELQHDFLWRTTRRLPERGRIGIFNRSYNEEALLVRVHPEILDRQRLPNQLPNAKNIWKDRYRSIVDLEEHLHRNGTRIVKRHSARETRL